MDKNTKLLYPVLLLSVLIIATCGLLYELLLSSISSYFLGNSILQFSLTIGIFMFFMGIGSYLSKFVHQDLFRFFVDVELILGFVGGISALALYFAYAYTAYYYLYNFLFISVLGALIGVEIPIVVRIINEYSSLKETMARVLSFDYVGALLASLIFPLVLLPYLGIFKTAIIIGSLNLLVAFANALIFREFIKGHRLQQAISFFLILIFFFAFYYSDVYTHPLEQKVFQDKIIFKKTTPYQDLVVTRWNNDYRLFINGSIQFSSSDEYRYHESLVHIPMALAVSHDRILVLGGGDGLAVREILKYPDVKRIDLVDLDPAMTNLGKNNPIFKKLNHSSLSNLKVHIHNQDAFNFIKRSSDIYSLVIIDLPDPNNTGLGKLYSYEFYEMLKTRMAKDGLLVTQSTSPYFARKAFWCIYHTLGKVFEHPLAYHANVPTFGMWGFVMAGKGIDFLQNDTSLHVEKRIISRLSEYEILKQSRFLNKKLIPELFIFPKDMEELSTEVNHLSNQKLVDYYLRSADNWR